MADDILLPPFPPMDATTARRLPTEAISPGLLAGLLAGAADRANGILHALSVAGG